MIRVLLVDDEHMVRASFRLLLEKQDDLLVVGEASTGSEAVALARRELPDVVLMDVQMPQMDGIEATRLICGSPHTPHTRVIILTTFELDEYVFAALRAGASGFLVKYGKPDDLLSAIQVVAGGESLLAPSVTRRLIAAFVARPRDEPPPRQPLVGVTDREREVLELVAQGLSNAEIGTHLRVSLPTVKTHVSRILTKIGARDRAQLVIAAYESGLIRPQPDATDPTM